MLQELIEWFAALRRGEKRIAPASVRGRVYERADGPSAIAPRATLKATLAPTRVYRAAEDAWYRVNPATGELEKE